MKQPSATLIVLAGALAGTILGAWLFLYLVKHHGAYGFAIPGVLTGLGASWRRGAPAWVAMLCGALALAASLFVTWKALPFSADDSLGYFVRHVHELPPYQLGLIGIGAFIGFWLPFRRRPGGT